MRNFGGKIQITRGAGGGGGVHAGLPHDLDQLEPEGRNVILDFVDVVLGNTLVFTLPLLLCHVSSHQVSHHSLDQGVHFRLLMAFIYFDKKLLLFAVKRRVLVYI